MVCDQYWCRMPYRPTRIPRVTWLSAEDSVADRIRQAPLTIVHDEGRAHHRGKP